ncbi:MAG: hypothetical protein FWF03_04320, partial [Defluviitaleaceae bacterium]|nr:hypothetical protein [Defluviitaleaceae bacterium]
APDFFARDMIANVIAGLDGDPVVSYKGPKFVDIATAKKDGKLLVSLTNTSGVYAENRLRAYYEILPVTDFEVIVKTGKRPEKVYLQPENAVPENVYDPASGRLTVRLGRLQIHTIIVIE